MPAKSRSFFLRGVSCSNAYLRNSHSNALLLRHIRYANKRRTEIPLYVGSQSLEWGDVNHPTARSRLCIGPEHQLVQAPQKRGQCLTRTRRRKNQRRLTSGNRGPPLDLWRSRGLEDGVEPRRRYSMKQIEDALYLLSLRLRSRFIRSFRSLFLRVVRSARHSRCTASYDAAIQNDVT